MTTMLSYCYLVSSLATAVQLTHSPLYIVNSNSNGVSRMFDAGVPRNNSSETSIPLAAHIPKLGERPNARP